MRSLAALLVIFLTAIAVSDAQACERAKLPEHDETTAIEPAHPITLEFDSGARWEMCWRSDKHSGLVLSGIRYAGPGMPLRKLLDSASVAQIVFQYDEDTSATHLLSRYGLGGRHLEDTVQSCPHGTQVVGNEHSICLSRQQTDLLTRARHYHSLPRNEMTLSALSRIGLSTFQQLWRFTEDGELRPSVVHSGTVSRFTNNPDFGTRVDDSDRFASSATLLVNWRLEFNINDTPDNDRIDQFDFVSASASDLEKHAVVTPVTTESFRQINSTDFRGWRISDADHSSGADGHLSPTRVGYYLDPQPSGYRLVRPDTPWTEFDLAVTNHAPCEWLASGNDWVFPGCAPDLNAFVDNETVTKPVLWFSLVRHFKPSREDFPSIRPAPLTFSLIPFDWSATSPFSDLATPINPSVVISQ